MFTYQGKPRGSLQLRMHNYKVNVYIQGATTFTFHSLSPHMCPQFKRDLFHFPALDFSVILESLLHTILLSYRVSLRKIYELPHFLHIF